MNNDEHRTLYTRLLVAYQADEHHPAEGPVMIGHNDLIGMKIACPGKPDGLYRIIIAAMVAHFRKDWRN